MKFKENQKTALSKVLSDLVQCDGIVNQGEIDFLHRVNEAFGITSASRKKATTLSLSDAVSILKTLGDREKNMMLSLFQALSLADNKLNPNESLLITALLTSLDMQLEATTGIKAHLVSIPHLNLDTSNAVLYVESEYDSKTNKSILQDYQDICRLLKADHRELFYLPTAISHPAAKQTTTPPTHNYSEPTLPE
jgi:uncharacterized tellurite resistance protein B-like protein